ncbi:MAG TPA: hypothetical protein VF133_06130, partial [Terriglobales bacterium]
LGLISASHDQLAIHGRKSSKPCHIFRVEKVLAPRIVFESMRKASQFIANLLLTLHLHGVNSGMLNSESLHKSDVRS